MWKINEYNSQTLGIRGGFMALLSQNLKFCDFFSKKREREKEIEKRRGLLTKAMC